MKKTGTTKVKFGYISTQRKILIVAVIMLIAACRSPQVVDAKVGDISREEKVAFYKDHEIKRSGYISYFVGNHSFSPWRMNSLFDASFVSEPNGDLFKKGRNWQVAGSAFGVGALGLLGFGVRSSLLSGEPVNAWYAVAGDVSLLAGLGCFYFSQEPLKEATGGYNSDLRRALDLPDTIQFRDVRGSGGAEFRLAMGYQF